MRSRDVHRPAEFEFRLHRTGTAATAIELDFPLTDAVAGVRRAFPPGKRVRLAVTKAAWDPDTVFRHDANIRPDPGTATCHVIDRRTPAAHGGCRPTRNP